MEDKEKEISEKKKDSDSTMNAIPEKELLKEEMLKKSTSPPFPQALHGKKGIRNATEILEKAFLTEQVSAILQCKYPLKYKDPRSPTISVMIGGKVVEKVLLDLGASVNLLPYSVYKKLGLGELKPTAITLSLADRSVKIPRGNGLMQLTFGNMTLDLNIFYMSKKQTTPEEEEGQEEVCIIDTLVKEHYNQNMQDKLNETLVDSEEEKEAAAEKETPKLNLKPLPVELKYTYLEENNQCPVVISSSLTSHQENCLIEVLKRCKKAIGWQISDLKGISPLVCTHHIYMEEEAKLIRQLQRRLNPHLQEVVRAEVLKLLQAGWRVCIDYRKLNAVIRKDHFPLPFIDQVLERVSGHPFYCFLDGYSGYFQIEIDVADQEKTTFTCPFGTYAYRRMPFGLCNAPATFQRCMLSIFSDMVERIMEVFMDDITVYEGTFEECLINLEAVLHRCIEKDLVLNWEKCHFMVRQGIVLGHIISEKGIEVDKAKVELIVKLPSPTTVKGVRQFLGHAGFYRRFIKGFSSLSKPLCELLAKDAKFTWDERCQNRVVLGQREDGKPYVIYYASKTLNEAQRNYTTTEKELLAVQDAKARLIRWILLLQEFDLQIKDKKGVENVVADHLSREGASKRRNAEKSTSPPFPQALHGKKGLEMHLKFLKGLTVNKKAFLTEQVSAILQCKSPLKYKDPGSPTISVMIGEKVVEKALLDLGASVNLLPYSVYKQLGLGELKPTTITLSLADRSVKIPRGVIEDVLVQVDNFYYPVDFIVLDTDPTVKEANLVPIILGRPFLATSNAIINCRNGLMQLTFGNMTLDLNIFYMSKKQTTPEEEEGPEEEGLSEPPNVLATLQSWRRIEEILPLFNKEEEVVAEKETPKLNLKPLPVELKYTYLRK
ncbi:Retrovirus-related Pol polyprotein from transposon 17.6 [Vitis vinifera]|uniref:RNA-directed DNA polymerase n=1 Tax=Vitis vinifera TaxID=29760 RepID=A0A438CU02_VITVI|nr:Retrovirus-related Pol polyprotein from transposon 17.6 [Vitis vinifera]